MSPLRNYHGEVIQPRTQPVNNKGVHNYSFLSEHFYLRNLKKWSDMTAPRSPPTRRRSLSRPLPFWRYAINGRFSCTEELEDDCLKNFQNIWRHICLFPSQTTKFIELFDVVISKGLDFKDEGGESTDEASEDSSPEDSCSSSSTSNDKHCACCYCEVRSVLCLA